MTEKPNDSNNPWLQRHLDPSSQEKIRTREITPEEIDYLRQYRFPFLQITRADYQDDTDDSAEPYVITKAPNSSWPIHDKGNAISSSPGLMGLVSSTKDEDSSTTSAFETKMLEKLGNIFKSEAKEEGGEDEGGAQLSAENAHGTIINQMVMTASDMVALALAKGWEAINIIDGSDLMQWAAWAAAQDAGIKTYGFAPSKRDKKKYERLKGLQAAEPHVIEPGLGLS